MARTQEKIALEFLDTHNRGRALFKQPPLKITDTKEMLEWIDCSLSPENLTCDGEAPEYIVRHNSRCLNALKAMVLEASGNAPYKVGGKITFRNAEYTVLKINRKNIVIQAIDGTKYNLNKTALV